MFLLALISIIIFQDLLNLPSDEGDRPITDGITLEIKAPPVDDCAKEDTNRKWTSITLTFWTTPL